MHPHAARAAAPAPRSATAPSPPSPGTSGILFAGLRIFFPSYAINCPYTEAGKVRKIKYFYAVESLKEQILLLVSTPLYLFIIGLEILLSNYRRRKLYSFKDTLGNIYL